MVVDWPGLSHQVQDMVDNYKLSQILAVKRVEPLIPTPCPALHPGLTITADLFELDNQLRCQIVADYFSCFVDQGIMQKTTKSSDVSRVLIEGNLYKTWNSRGGQK